MLVEWLSWFFYNLILRSLLEIFLIPWSWCRTVVCRTYYLYFFSAIAYHYKNDICAKWICERLFGRLHTYFTFYLYIIAFIFRFCCETNLLQGYFPSTFLFSSTSNKEILLFFILEWKINRNSELNWKFIAVMIYLILWLLYIHCCCCIFLSQLNIYFGSFIFTMQMLIFVYVYIRVYVNI